MHAGDVATWSPKSESARFTRHAVDASRWADNALCKSRKNVQLEKTVLTKLPIVDAHLDLAETVTLFGRDITLEIAEIRAREQRTANQATVSLPELERGGIAVIVATVTPGFLVEDVGPHFQPQSALYSTPQEAEAQAVSQINLYEQWASQGRIRLIKSRTDLDHHLQLWQADNKPGLVLLMEGADPIVEVKDLRDWWRRGLRMIGLTFGNTRYGAGVGGGSLTSRRDGLTADGVRLLEVMAELGFIWDVTHLTEAGMWQGLALDIGPVCATHANAQALASTNRHLSDGIIREIAVRNGVIGIVLYNGFLDPRWIADKTIQVSLADQARKHAEYIANLTGWKHVGIGSDFDGGFGFEESPIEIDTVAGIGKFRAVLPDEARDGVLSGNWLEFLRRSLPLRSDG
jgi:membrane dipeptidase